MLVNPLPINVLYTTIVILHCLIASCSAFIIATESPPSMVPYRKYLLFTTFCSTVDTILMGFFLQPHALFPTPCFQIAGYFARLSPATAASFVIMYLISLVHVGCCLSINSTYRYLVIAMNKAEFVGGKKGVFCAAVFHLVFGFLATFSLLSAYDPTPRDSLVTVVCFSNLTFLIEMLAFFVFLILVATFLNYRILDVLEKSGRLEGHVGVLRALIAVPTMFGLLPFTLWALGAHFDLGIGLFLGECILMAQGISNAVLTLTVLWPYRTALVRLWRRLWKATRDENDNSQLKLFVVMMKKCPIKR